MNKCTLTIIVFLSFFISYCGGAESYNEPVYNEPISGGKSESSNSSIVLTNFQNSKKVPDDIYDQIGLFMGGGGGLEDEKGPEKFNVNPGERVRLLIFGIRRENAGQNLGPEGRDMWEFLGEYLLEADSSGVVEVKIRNNDYILVFGIIRENGEIITSTNTKNGSWIYGGDLSIFKEFIKWIPSTLP